MKTVSARNWIIGYHMAAIFLCHPAQGREAVIDLLNCRLKFNEP